MAATWRNPRQRPHAMHVNNESRSWRFVSGLPSANDGNTMPQVWNHKALLAYRYSGEDGKPDRLLDSKANALVLKVSACSKTWVVQLRTPKPVTITIGKFPVVGLDDARRRAADLQERKEAGTLLAPAKEAAMRTASTNSTCSTVSSLPKRSGYAGPAGHSLRQDGCCSVHRPPVGAARTMQIACENISRASS